MGTMLREYETLFIMNPELGDDAATKVIDRLKGILTKMDAELLREDAWGKRKMAFYVKKQQRGNFHMLHYVGKAGVVEELERTMRNLEQVMRYLTIGQGEVKDVAAKKAEIDQMIRDQEAAAAKAEAERKEREERLAAEAAEAAARQAEKAEQRQAAAEEERNPTP